MVCLFCFSKGTEYKINLWVVEVKHYEVGKTGKTQSVYTAASLMHMFNINQCVTVVNEHIWSGVFQSNRLEDELLFHYVTCLLKTGSVVDLSLNCCCDRRGYHCDQ